MSHSQGDEIDLTQLLLKAVNVFSKYKTSIIVSVIVGIILGLVYYHYIPRIYQSSMMLRSDILTEAYSNTLTDNLKKLIDERGDEALAQKLNLTVKKKAYTPQKNIVIEFN